MQRSLDTSRVEVDEAAGRAPIRGERNYLIRVILDPANESPLFRLSRRPARLQDLTVRRIGNVAEVHEYVAFRAKRMKVGHVVSQLC